MFSRLPGSRRNNGDPRPPQLPRRPAPPAAEIDAASATYRRMTSTTAGLRRWIDCAAHPQARSCGGLGRPPVPSATNCLHRAFAHENRFTFDGFPRA